eukprot:COSAG04_NODE_83_length_27770_cov_5.100755_5_plen_79_part_00
MFPPAKSLVSASWARNAERFPPSVPAPKMTTAGLRGYLDTQKSEFLREVRTPLRFFFLRRSRAETAHESARGPVGASS